jgi:predicted MPP superfamily phosphohydrolase
VVIIVIELFLGVFAVKCVSGCIGMLKPSLREASRAWGRRIALVLLGALLIYVPAVVIDNTAHIRVSRTTCEIPGLPPSAQGFRILHISDLHIDQRTNGAFLDSVIARASACRPDIVVFTGDLVSGSAAYIDYGAEKLSRIPNRFGVYACLGNHDLWVSEDETIRAYARHGIHYAADSTIRVAAGPGFTISLTVITNFYGRRPDIQKTLLQQRPEDGISVLLTHQPSNQLIAAASEHGYSLVCAGHTHGGQFTFGLPGASFAFSRFETRYVSGFYRRGTTTVSVTNGIGLTAAPIRFQAPAEITLIELRSPER